MKHLYRLYWDCGRMGELDGLFIADDEDIKNAIGKEIYFGEVLGKHSEIYGPLEEIDLEIIDVPEDVVNALEKITGRTISGYNPLDYIEEGE